MAFRDETEALRARIEALEGELGAAMERVAELEQEREDAAPLRARIAELERELAKHAPRPSPPKPPTAAPRWGRTALIAAAAVGGAAGVYALAVEWAEPDPDASPVHGVVDLVDAPLPAALTGSVRGTSEAGSGCAGYTPTGPFVVLRTATPRAVRLWTEGGADVVLYVRTADGRVICDDDSGDGMNASLAADLPAGDHPVWVGTFHEDANADVLLRIDARRPEETALDLDAAPALGTIRVTGIDHHVREGRTSGDNPATLARPGCPGHVPNAPHVELDVREPGTARIVARSDEDLVLLVRRPDGSFACDDDGAGDYDPLVIEALALGRYRVWVGSYSPGATGDFELSVDVDAATTPDPAIPPRLGRWNLDGESLLSFSERVTGAVPVSSTHPECRTLYGSAAPDLELALGEPRSVTLSLTSDAFLGVLVEHPDGTQSCELPTRAAPGSWAAGTHRVFVAASEPGAAASFTLVVQTQQTN